MKLVRRNLNEIIEKVERRREKQTVDDSFLRLEKKYSNPVKPEIIVDNSLTWKNIQRLKPKLQETNDFRKITPRMFEPVMRDLGFDWQASRGARPAEYYIAHLESAGKNLEDVENALRRTLKLVVTQSVI
jgi:hypothetical protein